MSSDAAEAPSTTPVDEEKTFRFNPTASELREIVKLTRDLAYEITGFLGRRVKIELTDKGLGFTVPQTKQFQGKPAILHVSPIALLEKHEKARNIFRGIGYHESGHQKYDSNGQYWVFQKADEQGFHSVLNVVVDEWLERQIRSEREDVGRDLQILGNWAINSPDRPGGLVNDWIRCFRIHLPSDNDKIKAALDLVPKKLTKLSVWELLDLSREIAKLLELDPEERQERHKSFSPVLSDEDLSAQSQQVLGEIFQEFMEKCVKGGRGFNDNPEYDFNKTMKISKTKSDSNFHSQAIKEAREEIVRVRRVFQHLGFASEELENQTTGYDLASDVERLVIEHDPNIFVDFLETQNADFDFQTIIDCSGSMSEMSYALFRQGLKMQKMNLAKTFGVMIAEILKPVRTCTNHFWGFTTDSRGRQSRIFNCGTAANCTVSGLQASYGNNDAAALWHAAKYSKKSEKTHKILVMISDGLPTECSWEALASLVSKLEKQGFICVQVAVDQIAKPAFNQFVDLSEDPLPQALRKFGRLVEQLVVARLS